MRRGPLRLLAVSGLETLPPDQRAVLQLILVQGRGYDDLATLLKLAPEAVRSRAHAAVDALGADPPAQDALDAAQRTRIADYLLGQQDDGERIVTFAELGESTAACRWAQALRERLASVASHELPAVPAAASANGAAPVAEPSQPPVVAGASAVASPSAEQPRQPAPAAAAPPPAPPASGSGRPGGSSAPRPSRLGGAALLAGVAALVVVLAIVLIGGEDDGGSSAATTPAQTPAATRTGTATTPAAEAQVVGQVNLTATPAGGEALGVGFVQRAGDVQALAIEARRLPANGAEDFYAVWLQGQPGTRFLGFVPRQVRAGGSFTVTAELPANARRFSTVLVTREDGSASTAPTAPSPAVLSGALRFAR